MKKVGLKRTSWLRLLEYEKNAKFHEDKWEGTEKVKEEDKRERVVLYVTQYSVLQYSYFIQFSLLDNVEFGKKFFFVSSLKPKHRSTIEHPYNI